MRSTYRILFSTKTILLGVIAITLQGCFVAKEYQRPEWERTTHLFRTDQLSSDSLSMANISWKELFLDTELQSYIEEGLENNLDIRIAIQQMAAAEAFMKQGKAGYLPALTANASVTHQELSKNSQFGSFLSVTSIEQFELTGNLSWEADIWGKIRSNKRANEAGYLQTVAAHQAVKTQLVSLIATSYYQLMALDAQLVVTEKTVEARKSSVEAIQALKEAGQVTQVAVDQNIAQYNNARALVADLNAAIFQTENTLNLLLGRAAQPVSRGMINNQVLDTEIKLGFPSTLLSNRPDVMASEYALVQAFELTNVARSNFYPSLTISATGGFQSLEFDKLFSTNSLFATLVSGLAQPVFNRRTIKTQYEVAQARQEQALLSFKKVLLVAGNEVSNALRNYELETEKMEYRTNEVEALRRAESNSEELLKNGYANYLDLLTARQSALNAELNSINNKFQQMISIVNLYEALGGGWR